MYSKYNKNRKYQRGRSRQLGSIERDILDELTFGDLMSSFLLSGRSTKRFYRLARERATHRYRRKCAIERLVDLDYIQVRGDRLSITNTGKSALGHTIDSTRSLLKTATWDHKWRIAAFDIPEVYTLLRNKVREVLKKSGFVRLQQSIWIFPHECEELVQLIKKESRLSKHILYGVLDRIEDEERLKKVFDLHG